jgi:hypothetical protein
MKILMGIGSDLIVTIVIGIWGYQIGAIPCISSDVRHHPEKK